MNININEMKFGHQKILEDVTLEMENKGCYALVGKNGIGKTTTFKILCEVIKQYNGNITFKEDERISALIDGYGFYDSWKAYDFAEYFLDKSEIERFVEYAKYFNADSYIEKKIGKCSLGMKKRIGLSLCFASTANIILLDEPFNGLDDEGKFLLQELILKEKKDRLIVVTTHDFTFLSSFSDYILQIDQQKIITKDFYTDIYSIQFSNDEERDRFISSVKVVTKIKGHVVFVKLDSPEKVKEIKNMLIDYDYSYFGKEEFSYGDE